MNEWSTNELPIEPEGGLNIRFCEVMDAAPVMIWVSDQDKLCVWFNRPWLDFTGRRRVARVRATTLSHNRFVSLHHDAATRHLYF